VLESVNDLRLKNYIVVVAELQFDGTNASVSMAHADLIKTPFAPRGSLYSSRPVLMASVCPPLSRATSFIASAGISRPSSPRNPHSSPTARCGRRNR
jgi:hypothetical protein